MKLINLFITSLLIVCSLSCFAQDKNTPVLTVDGEVTTLEEFENIFRKNNRDSAITRASLDEYMELFTNFKLKVKEARERGMDTVAKFKNELDGYRGQLARPYMTDTDMLNDLIKEAYAHQSQEIHAAHILVKCDLNASPQDTLRAFNRIMALRQRAAAGEDFAVIARSSEGSEDPSVKENGGDLGYFTAFQMVYPFEEAAFKTPVGQISLPVRTRYGYHIIKVLDKRPARGEIHVAHIMVKPKTDANAEANAEAKIKEIHQKILSGENTFEDAASKYSDDVSSAKKSGDLPWFGTGKMVSEFEDAAFALQKDGDISAPVKTSFGWHIIKRLGYKPVPPFAEVEKDLKGKVSKDGRSEKTKNSFVEKLRREYNFSMDQKVLKKIIAKADTNVFKGKINLKKGLLKKPLFTINGNKYLISEYADYLKSHPVNRPVQTPQDFVRTQATKLSEEKLLAYEDAKLEEKHTAFRLLMKEYREGILLFELTDEKVWSRAVKDSSGLESYYENNKEKFMWPDRADVVIYTCATKEIAAQVRKMLANGKNRSDIAGELNKNSQLNLQIEEGVFAKEDKEILSEIKWQKGLSDNIERNGQIVITDVREILPSSAKKLEEARGMITSEYQTYLEQEWIKELRAKHKFQVNKDALYSIK